MLGHTFKDKDVLVRALTHASSGQGRRDDSERLEFLGDRVLGLIVAELLVERFPSEPEGGLAPRLNALVRKEALSEIAERIGLFAYIDLGGTEWSVVDRGRAAILADTCEAVIAALYIDGGLDVARKFICTQWAPLVENLNAVPRDAKTSLQEWAQARGKQVTYTLIGRIGPDHEPSFHVEARVTGLEPGTGVGRSKRAAEQAAAEAVLQREGLWPAAACA